MKTKVSIVKCPSYEQMFVDQAVRQAVDLIGGLNRFIKKGDKVFLKVNLLIGANPDRAITTHPNFVRTVIRLVKRFGAIPVVGDSTQRGDLESVAEPCGILKLCKEEGVKLLKLNTRIQKDNPKGKLIKKFIVAKEIFDFDCIINLPKPKTHSLTVYTGAVKNLYGLFPGGLKKKYHVELPTRNKFSNMLLDLYLLIKPQLTIMDAIIGMDGQGPSSGNPRKIGLVLASSDALALDTVITSIVGFKKSEVPVIYLGKKRNLPESDLKNILVVGESINSVKIKKFKKPYFMVDILPRFVVNTARGIIWPKPFVIKERCVGCGKCAEVCVKQTITMIDGKAHIDYSKCIRCYCCHEYCPHKAITLKRNVIQKVIKK